MVSTTALIYLANKKGMFPFLKVDNGMEELTEGVQLDENQSLI